MDKNEKIKKQHNKENVIKIKKCKSDKKTKKLEDNKKIVITLNPEPIEI